MHCEAAAMRAGRERRSPVRAECERRSPVRAECEVCATSGACFRTGFTLGERQCGDRPTFLPMVRGSADVLADGARVGR